MIELSLLVIEFARINAAIWSFYRVAIELLPKKHDISIEYHSAGCDRKCTQKMVESATCPA